MSFKLRKQSIHHRLVSTTNSITIPLLIMSQTVGGFIQRIIPTWQSNKCWEIGVLFNLNKFYIKHRPTHPPTSTNSISTIFCHLLLILVNQFRLMFLKQQHEYLSIIENIYICIIYD